MLPKPVSTYRRHGFTLRRSALLNRSRATNLAVLGLVATLTISLVFNILYLYSDAPPLNPPMSLLASLPDFQHTSNLNHLIIVPGHAIFTGTDPNLRMRVDQWAFQSYQTHQEVLQSSLLEVIFKHISRAARLALQDERSLVIFSGGQTQPTSTTTEGESYLRLALNAGLFESDTFNRATSENHALDSFQNLLFSIARFREYTASYPHKITVVGYEMKRARFKDLHRTAIRWPESKFSYLGIDPLDGDNSRAQDGERQNGYQPYMSDLYGCHTYLANKRIQRNYAARYPPYYLSCPELRPLLGWCPKVNTQLFSGTLPWSAEQKARHGRQ
ncbi:hypothetical protein B0H17DRAFT_583014 [Mycena rosella]|uniref:DUF218 domain-containing protein n=1 Tax=Mycena rosella TaxID=1033263 RepID=A0AAD7DFQ4_MYCRO|nr:hypothetical protein B0H17DRAFT_583014 [Mycena rosella]